MPGNKGKQKDPNTDPEIPLTIPGATLTAPISLPPDLPTPPKEVGVKSELANVLFQKFMEQFGKDPWYKDNPSQQSEDGKLNLSFKSEEDMTKFFKGMAKENHSFIIVDQKTNKVMGYSNGDGQIYHADGKEYKSGDKFKPGDKDLESFKMPESISKEQSSQKPS